MPGLPDGPSSASIVLYRVRNILRRAFRQVFPRRGPLGDCCWYHGGDWHEVNELAIRLVREAQRAGVGHDDVANHALTAARELNLHEWTREALWSLLKDTVRPHRRFGDGFNNGQHRAQAMLDAGVRRTAIEVYE